MTAFQLFVLSLPSPRASEMSLHIFANPNQDGKTRGHFGTIGPLLATHLYKLLPYDITLKDLKPAEFNSPKVRLQCQVGNLN